MQKKKIKFYQKEILKHLTGTSLALGAGSLAAFAAEEKKQELVFNIKNTFLQMIK